MTMSYAPPKFSAIQNTGQQMCTNNHLLLKMAVNDASFCDFVAI
jgi:hypothetical protein